MCPTFPFTEDELHTLCTEYGIAVCAPCAGPAGVEMILASGGRLRAARLAVHLTEIAAERGSAWVFWLDNDHLGGCLRGAVSAVPVCTVRPASDAV